MSIEQIFNNGPGRKKTILERLSNRRTIFFLSAISLILLLSAISGVVYYLITRSTTKNLQEAPTSLSELATQYPQIGNILNDDKLGSVYKQFLVEYQRGGEQAAMELARKRGILNANNDVRLTLELDTSDTAELQASLEAHGVRVTAVSANMMDIVVPWELVQASLESDQPGNIFLQISGLEHIKRLRLPETGGSDGAYRDTKIESLPLINAEAWHQAGITGKGVKIGILDVGFDNYKSLLGSALPENVQVRSFIAGTEADNTGEVHGTAVAEIIHAIAPDAELVMADYDTGAEMRQAVDWLVSQGVDIISNSTNFVHGPNDGTGAKAQMVDKVVQQGILWVNSAGNYALEHYRAKFHDSDGDGWHEFASGDKEMMVIHPDGAASLTLYWDDWQNPTQDLDLFLYDENENEIASSTDPQNSPDSFPVEYLKYEFPSEGTYYVAFFARNVTRPVTLNFFLRHGEIEYQTVSYSIGTPSDSRSSFSVGAVSWKNDQVMDYSSQGPSEDNRLVPEISAPTNTKSVAYGEPFGGTSSACPHVSGAAGLVLQAFPNYSPQQVTEFLISHSVDLGENGPDYQYGNGRLWLGDPPDLSAIILTPLPTHLPSPVPTQKATQFSSPILIPTTSLRSTNTAVIAKETPVVAQEEETKLPLGTLFLLGCVFLPGLLGMGGIGLLGVIWYKGRQDSAQVSVIGGAPHWVAPVPPEQPVQFRPPQIASLPLDQGGSPVVQINLCPQCGTPYARGTRFCPNCRQQPPLSEQLPAPPVQANSPAFCTSCGFALRAGAKFCPNCGRKIG
jgi:subtilisin family serine protease